MFSHKPNVNQLDNDDLKNKLLTSELTINVNSINQSQQMTLKQLCQASLNNNKSIIFTFTPGPFKSANELPKGWMDNKFAVGCSLQLSAFEKNYDGLNADVYAINLHNNDYQRELLAIKNIPHLKMISDEKNELTRLLNLPTFELEGKNYLKRFSLAINSQGVSQLFELPSSTNAITTTQHLNAVRDFTAPNLSNQSKLMFIP